jgi:hypothetical protein
MEELEARIARTESLFRNVNERIAESAQRTESERAAFVCECADADCTERVEAPRGVYEHVRSRPVTRTSGSSGSSRSGRASASSAR